MTISLAELGATCRPIKQWPGKLTRNRKRSPFRARWSDTVQQLARELRHLHAKKIVMEVAVDEGQIINDGTRPYANVTPQHPGVILSFESKHGPLRYASDTFNDWQDNIRAIALGLEALRKVDRYGITKDAEQYRGFKELPPPSPGQQDQPAFTIEQASDFIAGHCRMNATRNDIIANRHAYRLAYRDAASCLHPDNKDTGNEARFKRLQQARRILDEHHGL